MDYPFNHYSNYIKQKYGSRVQKITVFGGFTCPNRDGKVARGGCTYCNNDSFAAPKQIRRDSIIEQINHGIEQSRYKYRKVKHYFAYFQAFTNTYAPLDRLTELYEAALEHPDVTGICIGTRPDCVPDDVLDYLQELNTRTDVYLEYGLESMSDETLDRINRGHHFSHFVDAVERTAARHLECCAHLIIGFPWETKDQWIETARTLSTLPVNSIKLHQLHVVKHTPLAKEFEKEAFKMLSKLEYYDVVCDFLAHLRPDIVVQRLFSDTPPGLLISEPWGGNVSQLTLEVKDFMNDRGVVQGQLYTSTHTEAGAIA